VRRLCPQLAAMPQVVAKRGQGCALDFSLTETPAPTYLNLTQNNSREYRGGVRDYNNMLLRESRPNNVLDDSKFKGNGFPGYFQYIPYFGREPMRPGPKLERDIQVSTAPFVNSRALNTTMMGPEAAILAKFARAPTEDEHAAHGLAMSHTRSLREVAPTMTKTDRDFAHFGKPRQESEQRQQRINELAKVLPGMRNAGLASINPRMGTCGSLPDMTRLRGKDGAAAWQTCVPWALNGDDFDVSTSGHQLQR